MGWEHRETDCKQNCSYQPRCKAKSKEECKHYDNVHVDKRNRINFLNWLILVLKAMKGK